MMADHVMKVNRKPRSRQAPVSTASKARRHRPKPRSSLSPAHRRQLMDESGITEDIIHARGYRSLSSTEAAAVLKAQGFSRRQCQLGSGLLIPVLGSDGQPGLYQFRPDHPRRNQQDKVIKYETPSRSTMRLDMGIGQRECLRNPQIPLWITEGVKKGDAGRSHDLCIISLLGVWNFRGRNDDGGLTALGEWEDIALNNGRQVLIAFDSDVMRKPEVQSALRRLKQWLETKGAKVTIVYLPEGEGGTKVGLDDYLKEHTIADLYALAKMPAPPVTPDIEWLDAAPQIIRRPLCLIDGQAYATSWLPYILHVPEMENSKGVMIAAHDVSHKALVVMRQDGVCFSEIRRAHTEPLHKLGVEVRLPDSPKADRLWSPKGVKAYQAGHRVNPTSVFKRLVRVTDHFLDFDQSLADQQTMCELLGCYVFSTYYLEAFTVISYLWPNGGGGSGKTTLLNVIGETAYLGQVILAITSMPNLRDMADWGATLCFDEAENLQGRDGDKDKLALLLSGNRKGSTILVKEPAPHGKGWVSREVSTYCPRLFSAITLPHDTLESRTIVIPLIRSIDAEKANKDPLNPVDWPVRRSQLIDDLWSSALEHLATMPRYEAEINETSGLVGRTLEPWRPILAVAKWLQDQGQEGLYERMSELATQYQTAKRDIVTDTTTTQVIEAIIELKQYECIERFARGPRLASPSSPASPASPVGRGQWDFKVNSREIASLIFKWDEEDETPSESQMREREKQRKSLQTKVGIALKQLRFTSIKPEKRGGKREWGVKWDALYKHIRSYGLLSLLKKSAGDAGDAVHASPAASPALPPRIGDAGDAGDEVMHIHRRGPQRSHRRLALVTPRSLNGKRFGPKHRGHVSR
jgi:hypothetical protein